MKLVLLLWLCSMVSAVPLPQLPAAQSVNFQKTFVQPQNQPQNPMRQPVNLPQQLNGQPNQPQKPAEALGTVQRSNQTGQLEDVVDTANNFFQMDNNNTSSLDLSAPLGGAENSSVFEDVANLNFSVNDLKQIDVSSIFNDDNSNDTSIMKELDKMMNVFDNNNTGIDTSSISKDVDKNENLSFFKDNNTIEDISSIFKDSENDTEISLFENNSRDNETISVLNDTSSIFKDDNKNENPSLLDIIINGNGTSITETIDDNSSLLKTLNRSEIISIFEEHSNMTSTTFDPKNDTNKVDETLVSNDTNTVDDTLVSRDTILVDDTIVSNDTNIVDDTLVSNDTNLSDDTLITNEGFKLVTEEALVTLDQDESYTTNDTPFTSEPITIAEEFTSQTVSESPLLDENPFTSDPFVFRDTHLPNDFTFNIGQQSASFTQEPLILSDAVSLSEDQGMASDSMNTEALTSGHINTEAFISGTITTEPFLFRDTHEPNDVTYSDGQQSASFTQEPLILSDAVSLSEEPGMTSDSMNTKALISEPMNTDDLISGPINTEALTSEPMNTETLRSEPINTEAFTSEPKTTEPFVFRDTYGANDVTFSDGQQSASFTPEPVILSDAVSLSEDQGMASDSMNTEALTSGPINTEALPSEPMNTEALTSGPINTEVLTSGPINTEALTSGFINTEALTSGPINTEALTSEPITTRPLDFIEGGITAVTFKVEDINTSESYFFYTTDEPY